jgi:hypothetical protein
MRLRIFAVSLAAFLFLLVPAAQARAAAKADAYFGYSRVGANLYSPYTPGMNGWELGLHVKPIPFLGVEGDVTRYSAKVGAGSQEATLVMVGPRVTVGVGGFSVFAHGLAGVAHFSTSAVAFLPTLTYNATSYALGGGADVPLFLGFKLRATGDYLGNTDAPSTGAPPPSHYRFGVGVAYHF